MFRRAQILARHIPPQTASTRIARMSTFKLPDTDISVKLTDDLTKDELLAFPAFKNWIKTFQQNLSLQTTNQTHEFHSSPYTLQSIQVQAIDRFGPSKIGFMKISTIIKNNLGETLPGAIFLRGASVGMMILLQPDDLPKNSQDEKHVLLTVQARPASGSLKFVELPAGMVDNGSFKGAAAKEIQEELGLEIPEDELTCLTDLAIEDDGEGGERVPKAVFPSAGGCDEYIPIFLHEKRIPREQLKEWTGKLTGLRDEGEKITLKLVRVEDLWREGVRDAKALAAWALWEGLKRSGKL